MKSNKKRSSLKFRPIFCPKSCEEQQKKKVFTQISSNFLSKIRWRAKKQNRSSLKFRPIFCPKLGEEQKNKTGLHSNFVLFFAQSFVKSNKKKTGLYSNFVLFLPKIMWRATKKKKVFTQISSNFLSKIMWRATKTKKRSSLKFRPISCTKLGEEQKNKTGLHSDFVLFFAQN